MGRKPEFERELVIKKAMKNFWDKGVENTTSRQLADSMGMNPKSVYAEFKNKENLFLESLDEYQRLNDEVILKPIKDSNGDLNDIKQFFQNFVKAVKSGESPNGCLFANTAMEFGLKNQEVNLKLNHYYSNLHADFLNLLSKSSKIGSLSKDADLEELANYLVGCTEGLTVVAKVLDLKALNDFINITIRSVKAIAS